MYLFLNHADKLNNNIKLIEKDNMNKSVYVLCICFRILRKVNLKSNSFSKLYNEYFVHILFNLNDILC